MFQEWLKKYEKIKKQGEENEKKMQELLDKFKENSDEIIKSLEKGSEIVIKKNKENFVIYQNLIKKIK